MQHNTKKPLGQNIHFARIAKAIEYMYVHYKNQPSPEEVANFVHLSPSRFQQVFREWAGVTPKKFIQYLSIENAKKILKDTRDTLSDTADKVGLSGTGRLHDLFIKIEGMTPGEYKNGGKNLSINYSKHSTLFGDILVASTQKGICYLAFTSGFSVAYEELKANFPNAKMTEKRDCLQQSIIRFFDNMEDNPEYIRLHLKGTPFQLKVWEALLRIPEGRLTTYGELANKIDNPKSSRAVGSAVGSNPVSYFIPCHRVIRSTGVLGEYHWGRELKKAMIGYEICRLNSP